MTAFLDEVYDAGTKLDLDICDTSGFLRGHIVVDDEGNRLRGGVYTQAATEWAEAAGVEIMTKTKATGIIMDGAKVEGVEAMDSTGGVIRLKAKAVVVATGGTGKNTELVARYSQDACELADSIAIHVAGWVHGVFQSTSLSCDVYLMISDFDGNWK